MPWNSSKNGINAGHIVFQKLRPQLIPLVSHFSSLSRRLKESWNEVVAHTQGDVEPISAEDVTPAGKIRLPPLPRVVKPKVERLKSENRRVLKDRPWTLGLIEALAAVDVIMRQRFETRNRIALLLLDSNFEIALKEFIVHRADLFPPSEYNQTKIQQIFSRRSEVIRTVASKKALPQVLLDKAEHYYTLRNKLIHERATVGIADADVLNYRSTIEDLLRRLFNVSFES